MSAWGCWPRSKATSVTVSPIPRLTCTLARRNHVSVRYVHALFADVAESPASFVRRERLRVAYELLGHDQKGRHTVAGIARQVGFGEGNHLEDHSQQGSQFGSSPGHNTNGAATAEPIVPNHNCKVTSGTRH